MTDQSTPELDFGDAGGFWRGPLDIARDDLYECVPTTIESVRYAQWVGYGDMVTPWLLFPQNPPIGAPGFVFPDPDEEGAADGELNLVAPIKGLVLAGCLEVFEADMETVIDLVAWPIDKPAEYRTFVGQGAVLGAANIENPSTYVGGRPLRVSRTPQAWARAGGRGVCPIDFELAGAMLASCPGRLFCEDIHHARAIARMVRRFGFPAGRIVAATSARGRGR